jgi:hypothetical protein
MALSLSSEKGEAVLGISVYHRKQKCRWNGRIKDIRKDERLHSDVSVLGQGTLTSATSCTATPVRGRVGREEHD